MPENLPEDSGSQMVTGPSGITDEGLLIRMLHEEQLRLKREVDELRQKQQEAGDKKEKKQDEEEKGGDKKGKDAKDGKENQDGKDKDEKKPPLIQRVRAWVKEHPIGTVFIIIGGCKSFCVNDLR
jgi:hypothetical protein